MVKNEDNIFFSIVIPAYNEEENIENTCQAILGKFSENQISDFEILVVNDSSTDQTEEKLKSLSSLFPKIRYVNHLPPNGFGLAVRKGLEHFAGDVVCIVMGDLSDSPDDIMQYYKLMKQGHACIFGSRFINGSQVLDYPRLKWILNRFGNWLIMTLFGLEHNDITNAFKCYRREVIEKMQPLVAEHFNLTVEMPLKAIVYGYSYVKVPISWRNREKGESKLKIKEMGSRYFRVIFSLFFKRFFLKRENGS